ncbi:MAG: hypothetical protein AAGC93_08380 [Cyanobacteria bacterium P01_F01_bin.53]
MMPVNGCCYSGRKAFAIHGWNSWLKSSVIIAEHKGNTRDLAIEDDAFHV